VRWWIAHLRCGMEESGDVMPGVPGDRLFLAGASHFHARPSHAERLGHDGNNTALFWKPTSCAPFLGAGAGPDTSLLLHTPHLPPTTATTTTDTIKWPKI